MGKPAPVGVGVLISDAKAIMMIMHVRVAKLLCQAVMGWALVLKYLALGARGCL
jgi:hypothetical protein